MKTMKIKKEKKGEYTKFSAEVEDLCIDLEATIDKNGYGQCKMSTGDVEIDSMTFSSIRNWINFSKESEQGYKALTKFLSQIKKTEKISNYL